MKTAIKKISEERIKQIVDAYNNKEHNIRRIVNGSNVSISDLYKYIKENNIQLNGASLQVTKRFTINNLTKYQVEQIIELYQSKALNSPEIAQQFKIPLTVVHQCLKLNNVPRVYRRVAPRKSITKKLVATKPGLKKQLTEAEVQELIRLYQDESIPTKEINKRFNVTRLIWYRYLKEKNIPLRYYRSEKKEFTPTEIREIKRLYQDKTIRVKDIMQRFKVSSKRWYRFLIEQNIPKRGAKLALHYKLTEQQVKEIIDKYQNKNIGVKKLCRELKIPSNTIYTVLRKNNIPFRYYRKSIYETPFKKNATEPLGSYLKKRYFS